MAILALSFLNALSLKGAEDLLQQEGYVEEKVIEKHDSGCDRIFLYPYVLYNSEEEQIDCIFYVEYCNQVVDDEYVDGRMAWESIKTEWTRNA